MNVSLTPELEGFVQTKVISGRYTSASEVVREALRLLEDHDRARSAQLDLRQESDPSERSQEVERFQELVELKYTKGLASAELTEMDRLEAGFHDSDAAFYGPILDRVKAKKSFAGKRRSA